METQTTDTRDPQNEADLYAEQGFKRFAGYSPTILEVADGEKYEDYEVQIRFSKADRDRESSIGDDLIRWAGTIYIFPEQKIIRLLLWKKSHADDLDTLNIWVERLRNGWFNSIAWKEDTNEQGAQFFKAQVGTVHGRRELDIGDEIIECDEPGCTEDWHFEIDTGAVIHQADEIIGPKHPETGRAVYLIGVEKFSYSDSWVMSVSLEDGELTDNLAASFVNDIQWARAEIKRLNSPAQEVAE